jgi:DNA-binding YbaB/EbfC family protein
MNINPFEVLKNAQKIQEQMSGFQSKLETLKITGSSGGGLVEIDINGKMEMLDVRIAPETLEEKDAEMLQDLIMAAFSDGLGKVKEAISSQVGAMAGGLDLPNFPGVS